MVGMERACDFQELLDATNTVNHLSQIEYRENDLKFLGVYNKMNNIWAKLHKLEGDKVELDLGDYTTISSNKDVIIALKQGLKEVQRMIKNLNMAPNPKASARNRFGLTNCRLQKGQTSSHLPTF